MYKQKYENIIDILERFAIFNIENKITDPLFYSFGKKFKFVLYGFWLYDITNEYTYILSRYYSTSKRPLIICEFDVVLNKNKIMLLNSNSKERRIPFGLLSKFYNEISNETSRFILSKI